MNSTTLLAWMSPSMRVRISSAMAVLVVSFRARGERERVDISDHQLTERGVDHPVLLDARLPVKGARDHGGLKVILGARQVADLDARVGEGRSEDGLHRVRARHAPRAPNFRGPSRQSATARIPLENARTPGLGPTLRVARFSRSMDRPRRRRHP